MLAGLAFGEVCEPPRPVLVAHGRLPASLGCLSGVPWALLGRSWLSLGWPMGLQGCILGPRTAPGLDFGGPGDVPDCVLRDFPGAFDVLFATPRFASHNAFQKCSNQAFLFTLAFRFSPAARRYVRSTWN